MRKMVKRLFLCLATLSMVWAEVQNELLSEGGYCHVAFGEGQLKCTSEGKYAVRGFQQCCQAGNATGYSRNTSGIKDKLTNIFLRKKQVECTSCADAFSKTKKWCFAYRNPAESNCIHFPGVSTISAISQMDCCMWWNASGYTESPKWKWASGYRRWVTTCSSCAKDKFVACFEGYSESGGGQCSGTLNRLASSSSECCSRPNVVAYAKMGKSSGSVAGCFPCQVHGGWSEWSEWSPCSASCGQSSKRRVRSCINPVPKYNGAPCEGRGEEVEKCQVPAQCPESVGPRVHTALSGVRVASWSQWSVFSPCSATCGSGVMERRRTCNPALNSDCTGETVEIHPCEAHQLCNVGPSVNWMWTEWSPCHQTCGSGVQLRSKICLAVDFSAGSECNATVEMNLCDLPPCPSHFALHGSEVLEHHDDVSITVWLVPLVVIVVLAVWAAILFVIIRRRRSSMIREQSLKNLKRLDMRLPAIPEPHYEETYLPMDGLVNGESQRFIDEDGYEIPTDQMTLDRKGKYLVMDDSVIDRDAAANHVYEQLNFYQDKSDCVSAPTDVPEDLTLPAKDDT